MRPSSFPIGWSPWARSMMESRRAASPTGPDTNDPSLSGPRCTSVEFIDVSSAGSTPPGARVRTPQMPHTSASSGDPPRDGGGRLEHYPQVQADGAVRDVLEV